MRTLPLHFYNAKKGQKIIVVSPMGNKVYECVDEDYKFNNGGVKLETLWFDEAMEVSEPTFVNVFKKRLFGKSN